MPNYTVYYHPGFSGRAEPILLLLSDAGLDFTYSNDEQYLMKRDSDKVWPGDGPPPWAVPILRDGDYVVAQTTACLEYLGRTHGYIPDGVKTQANCLQLALNAADIWSEAYEARKQPPEVQQEFLKNRLSQWITNLEQFFAETNAFAGGGDYFFGAKPCYADFALLNVFHILEFMFDFRVATGSLATFQSAMETRPGIANFMRTAEPVLYDGPPPRPLLAAKHRL